MRIHSVLSDTANIRLWFSLRKVLIALLALGTFSTWAAQPAEFTGYVAKRAVNCFNPEPHEHEVEYFVVDDKTGQKVRLNGAKAFLKGVRPSQKVRVKGVKDNPSAFKRSAVSQAAPRASSRSDLQVEEIELAADGGATEPEAAGDGGDMAPEPAEGGGETASGANDLDMLSCLLVFISTDEETPGDTGDDNACMTSITNATNLLFDNSNNANMGMQAITKGRYGLAPYDDGNGATSNDHIIELKLNVIASEHDTDSIETLALAELFGGGGMGLNRLDYNRVLLFAPSGITDSGFTAYAYYPWGDYTESGMVSMYGNSYGNTRMNGYLHELGHNFDFRHSSKGGSTYGDRTCVMGLSNDGTRTETYNVVKLLQKDWLDVFSNAEETLTTDMTLDLYPLSSDPNVVTGTIAVSIPGTNHYVAYHQNDQPYGFLSQSGDRDKVHVYTNTGPTAVSFQAGTLSEGERYEGTVEVIFGEYGSGNAYATVSIDVDDGNDMPVLPVTTFGTGENTNLLMDLTAIDENVPGLTYEVVENPAVGSLSGTLPNVTYIPQTDFTGSDTFRIKVSDSLISNYITVTVLVFVDSDSDGLEDSWENQYFGNLSQGPSDNPDGDKDNNLLEFQNDTDPTRAPTLYSGKLTGTVIGTPGSYLNNTDWDKDEAHDGDLSTYYDAANANGDWTGLDLGSPRKIGLIKYAARSGWGSRMTGGKFQGSNTSDFSSGVVTFYTVSGSPAAGTLTERNVNDSDTYRYVRYLSPDNGYCNIAEVEFWEDGAPEAPTGLTATGVSGAVDLDWNNNSENDLDSYNVYRGEVSGTYGLTPIATGLTQSQYSDNSVVNGTTYYYVVSAEDDDNLEGANSNEAMVEYIVNDFPPSANAGEDQSTTISGGVAWTPAQLTTVAWYDASDTSTITETANAVSEWRDKSGNSLHLQGVDTRRPTTGATINGSNAIDFDGSNDQMTPAGVNPFGSAVADAFVIMVHKVDNDNNQGTIFTLTGSDSSGLRWQAHAPYNGTVYFDCGGTGGANRINADYETDTDDVVVVGFYGSTTDNVQQVFKNGTLHVSDTSGHSINTSGNFFVGSGAGSAYQDTTIGEMIIINGTVSPEDRQNLEGYLAHKWGTAAELPGDHPHKLAPPGGSGASVELAGTADDDDGNPLTTTWAKVSGTGTVSFSNASALNTTAYFSEADTYVLSLTADDGVYQDTDTIIITVTDSSDSDGDGMEDTWEQQIIDADSGDLITTVEDVSPTDDFDGDGVDNLTEYTNGSDPTLDDYAPAAPTGLAAAVGDGVINLDWDDNGEGDVNSYMVYRSTNSGSGYSVLQAAVGTSAFADSSAVNGTTYYYVVTAVDNTSNASGNSSQVSGTPVGGLLVSGDPRNGGLTYETYANEGQLNSVHTVPDFSRAGYGGGGVEIPFVGAKVTLTDDGGADDTIRIQNAINTVSALSLVNGFRGAVVLEAGDYTVSDTLDINASGVVIRGEGQQETGGTTITFTATTQIDLFHFHGSSGPSTTGSSTTVTDSYVPTGSKTINVGNASTYAPGDLIRITYLHNQQWVDDIHMGASGNLTGDVNDPYWDPAWFQVNHYRYVESVSGNEITLDTPLVETIDSQYGGASVQECTYTGAIENVGIENIRLESTYMAEDDELHGWEAIEMRNVVNGWIRQVTGRYFGMGLVLVDNQSKFVTVEDCASLDPKSVTSGGRKYSFNVDDSGYNLVQRTFSRGARHDYATGSVTPGPNVFVDSHAFQSNSDIGPHFRWATGELYDNIKSDNDINVQNRLNAGTSHGWAGAQVMFWNVDAQEIRSDAPVGSMNWSIGTVGIKAEGHSYMAPEEPFGIWQSEGAHVAPRSLYYAQLEDRLGTGAVRDVTVPEQEQGDIWTALQTWEGNGLLFDGVICWVAPDATLEVDTPINLTSRIRELNVQENLQTTTWSKASGPGNVIFGSGSSLDTTAEFDQQGTYVLNMTADDGTDQVVGTITLEITDPNFVAPPLAPTGLAATANDGLVSLDWNDNAESNVTYTVKRSLTSGSGFSDIQTGLSSSAYSDSGVTNGTTYFYIVTASVPGSDESENSNQQSATPNAPPAFDTAILVEAGATEGVAYTSSLADDAGDDDDDSLTFSRLTGPEWLAVATNGGLSGTPDANVLGLNEWTVRVEDGNGGSDDATLRITVANAAPSAPTGLSASAGNGLVTLNWTDSGDADWASYRVLRSTTEGSGYSEIATVSSDVTDSEYVDNTAANGTTYYYVVKVVDTGSLESPNSSEVSAAPEAPTLVQIAATDNSFIQASGPDSIQNVSSVISVNRGAFVYGAREAFIRIPLSGDDEIGGVDVDEIGSVTFDLFAVSMIANDTVTVFALLDGVQYPTHTLSESTWTGGTGGTAATGGNLTPNNRPDGPGGFPKSGYTTGALGSITFAASPTNDTLQQISITDLDTFKDLVRNDTNGEITLILRGNFNSPTNSFISVYNGGSNPKPTLSVERQVGPTIPDAPSNLAAIGGLESVSLTWTDNSGDETGFIVQRSTTSGSGFSTITTTAADATGYNDTGLDSGTEYFYQVIATNAAGDSAPATEASATTWSEAEAWRDQYFSVTANSGNAADTNDFDLDGVMNLLERAFGTHPTLDSSYSLPSGGVSENAGTTYPSITYRRLTGGTGTTGVNYTVDGMTYIVEYTGSLTATWNSGTVVQVGSASDNGDGTETVTVRTISGASPQFVRVRVSTTP